MNDIWLIKTTEPLPCDDNPRLLRMGLLAEILAKNDENHVTWWASSFDHYRKLDRNTNDSTVAIDKNYEIRFLKGITYNSNISIKRLFHHMHEGKVFLKRAKECKKPDVIVCAMPTLEMAYFASKYAKKNNVPLIIDIRDLFPDMYLDFVEGAYKPFVRLGIIPYKFMLRRALKNASHLVATSEKFLDWGANYAGRAANENDKVYYVSYPEYKSSYEQNDYWSQFGLTKEDFICCFFGKFGYTVDLETVMKAAKLLNGKSRAKFVICGEGEKLAKYKDIVGDSDNVIFPGWVDKDQIYSLGKISSVGLLAYKPGKNYEDSMPNKFCEYLALGQALLVEPQGMMLELASKHECGLHYKDEFELAEKILELEKNNLLISKMKENARALYEQKFCSDLVYADYSRFVESCIGRNK